MNILIGGVNIKLSNISYPLQYYTYNIDNGQVEAKQVEEFLTSLIPQSYLIYTPQDQNQQQQLMQFSKVKIKPVKTTQNTYFLVPELTYNDTDFFQCISQMDNFKSYLNQAEFSNVQATTEDNQVSATTTLGQQLTLDTASDLKIITQIALKILENPINSQTMTYINPLTESDADSQLVKKLYDRYKQNSLMPWEPDHQPAPQPTPVPQYAPVPEQAPQSAQVTPQPAQPAPQPKPQPEPQPQPTAQPAQQPAQPKPAPQPAPQPAQSAQPEPQPAPQSTPQPKPQPTPKSREESSSGVEGLNTELLSKTVNKTQKSSTVATNEDGPLINNDKFLYNNAYDSKDNKVTTVDTNTSEPLISTDNFLYNSAYDSKDNKVTTVGTDNQGPLIDNDNYLYSGAADMKNLHKQAPTKQISDLLK